MIAFSIFLNMIVLLFSLVWLYRSNKSVSILFGIVFSFLGLTFVSFVVSFLLESEFLSGIIYLIIAGINALVFWLIGMVLIFTSSLKKNVGSYVSRIGILSLVLLIPIGLVVVFDGVSLKIGG